jgi:hypothetical protein
MPFVIHSRIISRQNESKVSASCLASNERRPIFSNDAAEMSSQGQSIKIPA